jgi:hypothetical protein
VYLFSYFEFSSACRKILRGADDFTFFPNEGVLRIFIALESLLLSDGFEPANQWVQWQDH